jgi:hypothetical protein
VESSNTNKGLLEKPHLRMQKGDRRAFVYIEQYLLPLLKLLKDNKAHLRATLNQIEILLK